MTAAFLAPDVDGGSWFKIRATGIDTSRACFVYLKRNWGCSWLRVRWSN